MTSVIIPDTSFIHHSISPMIIVDEHRIIVGVNVLFCELFEYEKEELLGHSPEMLIPDKASLPIYQGYFEAILAGEEVRAEVQYKKRSGAIIWISLSGRKFFNEEQRPFVMWSFVNITKRVEYRQKLERSNAELTFLFQHAHVGIIYTNHGIITKANPFFSRHFGYLPSMLEGNSIRTVFASSELFKEGSVQEGMLLSHDHPHSVYVRISSHLVDEDETVVWLITDLSKEYEQIERLRYSSMFDSLTSAYNRMTFIDKVHEKLPRSQKCALLLLDIDFFKNINDSYGHIIGDKVLVSVVECIQSSLRSNDLLGRVGGEEFAIFLPRIKDNEALLVSKRILENIRQHWHIKETLHVTASIGVCVVEGSNKVFSTLYEKADEKLYEAKRNGRNRVEIITL